MEGYIKSLQESLASIGGDVFNLKAEDRYSDVIDACRSLLLGLGYSVFAPMKYTNGSIVKIDHLIALFYNYLYRNHPEKRPYRNIRRDRGMMASFVESRLIDGVTKQEAMNECGEIITTIFKYEKEFKFKPEYEVRLSILSQGKCAWITEKAVDIINRERNKIDEQVIERRVTKVEQEFAEKYKDDYNLDKILKVLGG